MTQSTNFTFKVLLYLIVCFFTLLNCTEKSKQETFPTIHIDPDMEPKEADLSELATEIKVVPLETNLACLIGGWSHLEYVDEKYIIYRSSSKSDKALLIFNSQGGFLNKIDAYGEGPEEYTSIESVLFDSDKELIYISDHRKVQVYNMKGNFIKSLKTSFPIGGLYQNHDGQFLVPVQQIYAESNRDMLHIMDAEMQLVKSIKSRNPEVISDIQQGYRYHGDPIEANNQFFYKEPFVDTLYEIRGTGLKPYMKFDLNGKGFSTRDGINPENYQQNAKRKIPPIGPKVGDNLIFIQYTYIDAEYLSIYDKASQKNIFHKKFLFTSLENNPLSLGINNDLVEGSPAFLPKYVKDNIMVSVVEPGNLTKDQRAMFKVKREDNPILLIATIKD